MRLALALCLLSSVALGQGNTGQSTTGISRGNGLRIPVYETPGTGASQNYFVDGTLGLDTNTCTASGTSACLTIQGAVNKIPKLIRDGVTVSIAAGTYGCVFLQGFSIDFGAQTATGGFLLDGALANVTPATGTATGTATAGSAGATSTFGTITDSGQTWTVNNLRGKFVVITGGTGSGQTRVISSNTATAITIVGTWTSPTAGSTYAIQSPSVNINTACTNPASAVSPAAGTTTAIFASDNEINYRTNAITIRNIGFTNSTGGSVLIGDSSVYQILQTTTTGASPAAGIQIGGTGAGAPRVTVGTSSFGNSGAIFVLMSTGGFLTISNSLSWNGAQGLLSSNSGQVAGSITGCEANAVSTIGLAIGEGNYAVASSRFDCAANASNFGISVGTSSRNYSLTSSNPLNTGLATVGVTTSDIGTVACGQGIVVAGAGQAFLTGTTGSAITNAYSAQWGGRIFQNGANTATGATADWNLNNGAVTGAIGDIAAGGCIQAAGYGSMICN